MAKATQFCIALDNKRGALARLCGLLKRANVDINAIAISENAECGWVRLVATPTAAVKSALADAGRTFWTQRVLTIRATQRPGELERIAGGLAKAGININYVYGSNGEGQWSLLVLNVDDPDRAGQILAE